MLLVAAVAVAADGCVTVMIQCVCWPQILQPVCCWPLSMQAAQGGPHSSQYVQETASWWCCSHCCCLNQHCPGCCCSCSCCCSPHLAGQSPLVSVATGIKHRHACWQDTWRGLALGALVFTLSQTELLRLCM